MNIIQLSFYAVPRHRIGFSAKRISPHFRGLSAALRVGGKMRGVEKMWSRASRRKARTAQAATFSRGSASLLACPLLHKVDLLGNMELLWVYTYGNRALGKSPSCNVTLFMGIFHAVWTFANVHAWFCRCLKATIKVVSCLLAATVADPLGAGAVGDGCELQKVLRNKKIKKMEQWATAASCKRFLFP